MNIATCSYTEFRPEMGVPVRFTVSAPRWNLPYQPAGWARLISPTRSMLHLPGDAYTRQYFALLNAAGVDAIRAELTALAGGADRVVLLCYERLNETSKTDHSPLWCHRSLFAHHWRQQTGEVVPELGKLPASGMAHTPVPLAV